MKEENVKEERMRELVSKKKTKEKIVVLSYFKIPSLLESYTLDKNTIVDSDFRLFYELAELGYSLDVDITNIISLKTLLKDYPEFNSRLKQCSKPLERVLREAEMVSENDFQSTFQQNAELSEKIRLLNFVNKQAEELILDSKNLKDEFIAKVDNILFDNVNIHDTGVISAFDDDEIDNLFDEACSNALQLNFAEKLNLCCGGLGFGDITIFSGLSGIGKSTFSSHQIIYNAVMQGIQTVVLSNELDKQDYRSKFLSLIIYEKYNIIVEFSSWRNPKKLNLLLKRYPNLKDIIKEANEIYNEKVVPNLKIFDKSINSLAKLKRLIKINASQGARVFLYDTARPFNSTNQGWAEATQMLSELDTLVKNLNVALILNWQIANSNCGKRNITRADLSESKDIVKSASSVFTLRKLYEEEFADGNYPCVCYRVTKNDQGITVKEHIELEKDKRYVVLYIDKLRYSGEESRYILYENIGGFYFKEKGFCKPKPDNKR